MIYAEGAGPVSIAGRGLREALVTWMILLVGLAVGVVSGVVGIGGGVLFIPALIWLLGMDQHKAQGTSLGALLAPVGIFAFMEYYRKGNADLRVGLLLAAGFLLRGRGRAIHSGGLAATHLRHHAGGHRRPDVFQPLRPRGDSSRRQADAMKRRRT
jgi:hypothetical protein